MNFKKTLILFCIGLPLCIAARLAQITWAIENSNGFYKSGYEMKGNLLLVFIAVVCIAVSVVGYITCKTVKKAPKVHGLLSLASFCVAFSLIAETFFENMPKTMPAGQMLIVKTVTLFCGVYFVAFGVQGFTGIRLRPILHAMPALYAIAKTIFTFINVSSLAIISDNLLLMTGYCFLMLFFISFGKLYNKLDCEKSYRRAMATGLGSAIICATQSLAYFAANIFGKGYSHSGTAVMISLFSISFFAFAFVTATLKAKK